MPKSILLADDSVTIRKVVELTFSETDYELVTVSSGTEALEALARMTPSLVIADAVMPDKNGYEVCEAIRANPVTAHVPVILLSGAFEPFDRERAEKVGVNRVITKPFDSKSFLAQVEGLLGATDISSSPAGQPAFSSMSDGEVTAPFAFAAGPGSLDPFGTGPASAAPREPEGIEFDLDETSPFGKMSPANAPAGNATPGNIFEFPAPEPADTPPAPETLLTPDLEQIAHEASISDLASMVSRVAPEPEVSRAMAIVPSPASSPLEKIPPPPVPAAEPAPPGPGPLSEGDLDRLARRVAVLLSEKAVQEVAWEVVPEIAETLVQKRIRELEAEAGGETK